MSSKQCSKCSRVLSLDHYHKRAKNQYRNDCKDCVAEYGKLYRECNSQAIKRAKRKYHKENPHIKRQSYLRKTYGISIEDYEIILQAQGNKCAICESENVGNSMHKNFHVDHCHESEKIRGLLCSKCNTAIGLLKDKKKSLQKAIKYLTKGGSCGS